MNWFQAKRFLLYLINARHWKGFGIHSPFVFDVVANLMREPYDYYDFKRINAWRHALLRSRETIEVADMGAGSVVVKSKIRKVANIVRYGSMPEKYGKLLFRLVSQFKPNGIIELGTSAGISALYLVLPNKSSNFVTIEGCRNTAGVARYTFQHFGLNHITMLNGSFNDQLPKALEQIGKLDFVFLDRKSVV